MSSIFVPSTAGTLTAEHSVPRDDWNSYSTPCGLPSSVTTSPGQQPHRPLERTSTLWAVHSTGPVARQPIEKRSMVQSSTEITASGLTTRRPILNDDQPVPPCVCSSLERI